ncbi:MAG TPA: MFS transporter [Gammaproteobacteria bacterium]
MKLAPQGRLHRIHPTARRLLASRALRSVAQGALVADLSLYLHALGWSGLGIGLTFTAAGLGAAFISLLIGRLSDRYRRKPFLMGYEALTVLCGLTPLLSHSAALLVAVIVLGGFGRGMNGAAGPFGPAEQAWLAEAVPQDQRAWVYSINNALGFFGMALGALLAVIPGLLLDRLPVTHAYSLLFLIVIAGALGNLMLLAATPEAPRGETLVPGHRLLRMQRWENHLLWRLVRLNALNGFSMGLTGPLVSYWFALKFHAGPDRIAPVMAMTFALAAVMALFAGRVAMRHGLSRAVVWSRGIGVLMLLALPFMPWFWLAALIYMLRLASGGASVGARQAQIATLVRDERRGLAASVNAASFQIPQSAGPGVAGPLIAAGWFVTPFCLAAALQAIYVLGYDRMFGRYDRRADAKDRRDTISTE